MALLRLSDPVGWCGEDVVDDAKHVVIRLDLLLPGGILLVLLLFGDLVEHLREEEVKAGVRLDCVLEPLQGWVQLLVFVVLGLVDEFAQGLSVSSVVLRQPGAGAVDMVLVWDAGVLGHDGDFV